MAPGAPSGSVWKRASQRKDQPTHEGDVTGSALFSTGLVTKEHFHWAWEEHTDTRK